MPSYEAKINIENTIVGDFRANHVYAASALFPRLGINFDVEIHHPVKLPDGTIIGAYRMADLAGQLRLGEGGPAIGSLEWIGHRRAIRSVERGISAQINVVCDLDLARVEQIERIRGGEPPQLRADLWPTLIDGARDLWVSVEPLRMDVPRDEWARFLEGIGYGHVELLEIRWSAKEQETYAPAGEFLRTARAKLGAGDWTDAVAECRKALEVVAGANERERDRKTELLAAGTDAPRARAYMSIVSKLKTLTNLTHHAYGAGSKFSRAEAQFAIRATESIVALIADRAREE